MSRQSRGLQYEHDLAKEIFELSDGKIIPLRSGWSGNQALPSPDLLIPFGGILVASEIKTTSDDTSLIISEEDLEDIAYWTMRMSEIPVYPYLGVKFTGRSSRLIYFTRLTRIGNSQKCFENEVEKCPFDASITRTGNLSFKKPDTDQWPSTQTGDGPKGKRDGYEIIQTLREEDFDQPSVIEVLEQKESYIEEIEGDD